MLLCFQSSEKRGIPIGQWLGLSVFIAVAQASTSGWGTRSHKPSCETKRKRKQMKDNTFKHQFIAHVQNIQLAAFICLYSTSNSKSFLYTVICRGDEAKY